MKKIVVNCTLGWLVFGQSMPAVAGVNQIEPAKLEQIRGVGQALLAAKRNYQQTPEQQQFVNDIKHIRTLINTLLNYRELDVTMSASVPANKKSFSINSLLSKLMPESSDEKWRNKHASDIDALIVASGSLSQQMQSALQLQKKSKTGTQNTKADPLLNLFPAELAARLANLYADAGNAVALPKEARDQELQRLLTELTSVSGNLSTQTVDPVTPTISTKNTHRSDTHLTTTHVTRSSQ